MMLCSLASSGSLVPLVAQTMRSVLVIQTPREVEFDTIMATTQGTLSVAFDMHAQLAKRIRDKPRL